MALLFEDLKELCSHFNEFRLDKKFYDVVIKVEDQFFHCHRIILASAMEYFRTKFADDSHAGEKTEIELENIKANDFELLLNHVYGKRIEIKAENVYRLLRISNYLGSRSLENAVVSYIVNSYSIPLNTALTIFIFACKIKKNVLIDGLTGFIAENFSAFSKNYRFARIPGNYLQQILTHCKLDENSTTLLDFFKRWVKYQGDEGKKFLPQLLTTVNLSKVSKEWFMETILNDQNDKYGKSDDEFEIIGKSSTIMDEIDTLDQFSFCLDIADDKENHVDDSNHLHYLQSFLIVTLDNILGREQSTTSVVNSYKFTSTKETHNFDFLKNEFDFQEDLPVFCKSVFVDGLRFTITCVEKTVSKISQRYDNDYYSYNYYDSYDYYNRGRKRYFDDDSDSSEDYYGPGRQQTNRKSCVLYTYVHYNDMQISVVDTDKIESAADLAVAAHGSDIYIYSDYTLSRFETQGGKWMYVDDSGRNETLKSSNLLSYNNGLYFIGGNEYSVPNTTENQEQTKNGKMFQSFDPRESKWSTLPPMNYSRSKSASCIYEDKLYVSGGDNLAHFKGCIECFDFKAGKWDIVEALMPEPKMNHTMLAQDNQLWFFGGQKRTWKMKNSRSWYVYDLMEKTWSNVSCIPKSHGKYETQQILDVIKEM